MIPIAEIAAEKDYTLLKGVPGLESDIRGDVILLVILAFMTLAYFSSFDAPLLRTAAEEAFEDESGESREDAITVESEDLVSTEAIINN